MPSAVEPNPRAGDADDLDDLFNYDPNVEDGSRADQQRINQPPLAGDMDEEIKVTRKRAPVAKLDEARSASRSHHCDSPLIMLYSLLSNPGIPKLRKISKSIRFKGKGHEVRLTSIPNAGSKY